MNPQMPQMPGVGAVTDSLDFVKNLWGSMTVPGMNMPGLGAPALSLDDLDKKIADLKAVEAWLNINMAMLRGTVQTLEVQRGTVATIKSMGASLAAAMNQPGADEKAVMAASPFAAFFTPPAAANAPAPGAAKAAPAAAKAAPAGLPGMPDPTLWWNVLQEQFTQAVASVMSPEAIANASAMAQEAAARMGAAAAPKAEAGKSADKESSNGKSAGAADKAPASKGKPGKH